MNEPLYQIALTQVEVDTLDILFGFHADDDPDQHYSAAALESMCRKIEPLVTPSSPIIQDALLKAERALTVALFMVCNSENPNDCPEAEYSQALALVRRAIPLKDRPKRGTTFGQITL
jgi:hypothetical protein